MVDSEHVPRLAREFDYRGTASYPKPRYCDPIVIDLDYYQWLAVAGMPNVSEKTLGTFTERQCAVSQVELGRGANHRVGSCSVYLVLWGAGLVRNGPYRVHTALHLDDGETAEMAARHDREILRLVLTDLADLDAHRAARVEAAE